MEHQIHPHVQTEHHEEKTIEQTPVSKPINSVYYIASAILVGAVLISGSIFYSTKQFIAKGGISQLAGYQQQAPTAPTAQAQAPAQPQAQPADVTKVKLTGEPSVGNPNAKVTIAYWFDYQCPFCKKFEADVMPKLMSDYVQTGKVRIVFKDFQFLGQDSQTAGLYARAVWETAPDKFYQWHKAMYENQGTENTGWVTKDKMLSIIKMVPGLDASRIQQLVDSKKAEWQKDMDADKAEGSGFGVTGTPSLIVGNQLVVGAQPLAAFTTIIDQQLK
jgi:protein-disulfide isomerase